MSSPGIGPRKNKSAAGPEGNKGPRPLRVLSQDGSARVVAPSIAMPRAKTELSALLVGDDVLCVRKLATAAAERQNADRGSCASGAVAEPPDKLPATPTDRRSGESSMPADIADGDLAYVIDAWPGLPRDVRLAILAVVRKASTSRS
jgi:hypothetical protein